MTVHGFSTKTPNPGKIHKHRRRIRPCIIVAAFAVVTIALISCIVSAFTTKAETVEPAQASHATEPKIIEVIVTPPEPIAFFELTPEQRTLIEQVVSAESRGEPYAGQLAVAQCILNACMIDGITPEQAIEKYKYTTARAEPTDSVKEAVAAVFDRGEYITEEPLLYFYNPALVDSEFHESQDFVIEINNHRFFKEATRWG